MPGKAWGPDGTQGSVSARIECCGLVCCNVHPLPHVVLEMLAASPSPSRQEIEIFSEEHYHPMRTNLKILTLGVPQLMAHSSHSSVKVKVHKPHAHAQLSPHV